MASEVTTMTRKRRKFSKEFKLETVKLVKEGPRSIGEIHEHGIRRWCAARIAPYSLAVRAHNH